MHSSSSSSRRPHPLHPPPPVAFRPFLGHDLPDLLPPVFSVSCCHIPVLDHYESVLTCGCSHTSELIHNDVLMMGGKPKHVGAFKCKF